MTSPEAPTARIADTTPATEPFSVIIPAHNEANVIVRCLTTILADAPVGAVDILVVCNGCTDDTADRARAVSPEVRVIELDKGSKPLALNAGNAQAKYDIKLFIDADISVSYPSLAAIAAELRQPGVMAASPALVVDLSRTNARVRSYYKVWMTLPYVLDNMVGSGAFGLSVEGMKAIGEFPPIIADDEYVRTRFSSKQRRLVREDAFGQSVYFTVHPPRNLHSLIKVESRQRAGLSELHRKFPSNETRRRMTTLAALLSTLEQGASLADLTTFLAVKILGRAHFHWQRLRKLDHLWLRDESSRQIIS